MSHADLPDTASHETPLTVRLLGDFAVSVGGEARPAQSWPSLRAMHLVQLLSLAPRHRLPREAAIDALWPQLSPDAGAANLRKAAHHARQALGRQDGVVLQGGDVALWPGRPVQVDAEAFEQQARSALAQHDASACAQAALAYAGELLPGAPYEAWVEPARERLRACFIELLRASAQWERLAEIEPTDEPAHRALMTQALARGNRASAIRWYASLRSALQQQLGVMPEPETEALYERCLEGLPHGGPAYVGRALARAQLAAWLALDARERPAGIVLRGPAGIGKTALCRELETLARARGWCVLRVGAVQPGHTHAVMAALAESLILSTPELLDKVGTPARSVLALLSPLAAPADALPGPVSRHQMIGALRRLLLAASGGGQVMLQVDDAHLVADADVDVLMHLVSAGPPLCVVLATRTPAAGSALARGLARLGGAGVMQALDLAPLADDEAHQLVALAAARSLPADVAARIVQLADGNPFAAIELARSTGPSSGGHLPASTAEAITARLCDVPDAALALLKWLALSGDEFDATTAAALAPTPPGAPEHAFALLDAALAAGTVVLAGTRYRFRHELVRQALIDQIAPHQRLKMHRQAAQQLAELDAAPAIVARHWLQGGSPREAMPWLLEAAREALRLAAPSDALGHLAPLLAFQRGHAEALRLRAQALDDLGDPGAVAAYLAAAAATGEPLSHDLRAQGALAQVKLGDPKGGLLALVGVQPSTVQGRLAEALAYCGAAALGATTPDIGTEKAARVRQLALQSGDKAAIVVASWAQAAAAHARGELHHSVWADLHETRDVPHLAMRLFDGQLCITQRFLYGARPYAEVIAFAQKLADEAQRLGAARGHAFGTTLRGEAELLSGDLESAEAHLRLGARLHRAIGGATGEAFSLQRLAEVASYRGRLDDAQSFLDEALDVARQTDIGFHLLDRIYGTRIQLAQHKGGVAAALHALHDARDAVRGPLETCPGCRITFAVPAAIAAARAGELDMAGAYEAQSAYLANVVMRLPAWYAAHDEVRAHVALARGDDPAQAASSFAQAAARFHAAGQPLDGLRCEGMAQSLGHAPAR